MADEAKPQEKPMPDARVRGVASCAPGVAWWPASRLMLDIIKQG